MDGKLQEEAVPVLEIGDLEDVILLSIHEVRTDNLEENTYATISSRLHELPRSGKTPPPKKGPNEENPPVDE